MKPFFEKKQQKLHIGLLILRIGIGIMFILHGWPKITGGPERWEKLGGAMSNLGITQFPVFWGFMAAFAETAGGLLLALGLFFYPACILLLFTMIVAAVMHISKGDGLGGWSQPIELATVVFSLLVTGAGSYRLDKYVFNRKSKARTKF
jgi:putative oxidoreductase